MIGWQKFVKPSYLYFVEPTRIFADVIVNTSELSNQDKAIAMILAEVQKA
jgi:uridine kinase